MYLYSGGLIINVLLVNEICGGGWGGGGSGGLIFREALLEFYSTLNVHLFLNSFN